MDFSFLMTVAEGATNAAEAGGHSPLELFPKPFEVIWTIINFAILLAALYKFLYKPLLGAISTREAEMEAAVKKVAGDLAEADRLRKEFEANVANAQRDAQEIINKATKAATVTKEQIEAEARGRASELLENATKTIEREKAKAISELREEVASLAIAIAGKVIEKNLNTDEQKRLADRFVAEVGAN